MPRRLVWPYVILLMINLLPTETIVSNQRGYRRRRLLVAGLLLISLWLLVLGVLVYFTWVVQTRAVTVGQQLVELKKRAEAKELIELERNWRLTEQQVKGLAWLNVPAPSPAALWAQIMQDRPNGIRLGGIDFAAVPNTASTTLVLKGTASSRRNFLTFVEQLRADNIFSRVDSPVDNLIKDSETPFIINLEIHEQR